MLGRVEICMSIYTRCCTNENKLGFWPPSTKVISADHEVTAPTPRSHQQSWGIIHVVQKRHLASIAFTSHSRTRGNQCTSIRTEIPQRLRPVLHRLFTRSVRQHWRPQYSLASEGVRSCLVADMSGRSTAIIGGLTLQKVQ